MKKKVENVVEEIARPIVEELGYILYDIEYVKEEREWYLRIYIDTEKEEGILIEDCQAVSNALDPILDEKDPIPDSYYLEVSSPGLDRKLLKKEHFDRFLGEQVVVKTKTPVQNKKKLIGKLMGMDGQDVTIQTDKEIKIPCDNIKEVRLDVIF